MYQVERAIFDLRRGVPVLLRGASGAQQGHGDRLVQPVEGRDDGRLGSLVKRCEGAPRLVVSRHRLAAQGCKIEASAAILVLEANDLVPARLAALSHGEALLDREPQLASATECIALDLMRRALLLPAALVAPVADEHREEVEALVAEGTLLAIACDEAREVLAEAQGGLVRVSEAEVPLADAEATRFILFRESDGLREHVAIVIGRRDSWSSAVPLRLHSACLTGDLFASLRCDCGEQLRHAVADILALGGGVLLYLAQEGRGIGLANKLRAYGLQDTGLDTVEADQRLGFGSDERDYRVAVDMLRALAIERVQMLTNNPHKIAALSAGGIEVTERHALYGRVTEHNRRYLAAKASRAGHWLSQTLDQDGSG
ncbi:GTP cyclohydrolase II [Halomonas sp. V046]|uniref:GTP cyclohydrolase II n=1 Tax=Halomonas sp. V046 TaxID=3459611 RepID=UPI0040443DA3